MSHFRMDIVDVHTVGLGQIQGWDAIQLGQLCKAHGGKVLNAKAPVTDRLYMKWLYLDLKFRHGSPGYGTAAGTTSGHHY
jgi:hypothetical protein